MGTNLVFFGKKGSLYQNFDIINSKSHNFATSLMGKSPLGLYHCIYMKKIPAYGISATLPTKTDYIIIYIL